MTTEFKISENVLNNILNSDVGEDSKRLMESMIEQVRALISRYENDAEVALFIYLRIMNMAAAKAAGAMEVIHFGEVTNDPIKGYEAGIVAYDHMKEILVDGLNKAKKKGLN